MSAGDGDPVLNEIEVQLALAYQALGNVVRFVARLNTQSDQTNDTPADTDGDDAFPSFDTVPPITTTGGRPNGRRQKQSR